MLARPRSERLRAPQAKWHQLAACRHTSRSKLQLKGLLKAVQSSGSRALRRETWAGVVVVKFTAAAVRESCLSKGHAI